MGAFQTSDGHGSDVLKPLRVAVRKEDVFAEAKSMVEDLPEWRVVAVDEAALAIECERKGGLMAGPARIRVWVEGPEGIPSATVHVRSESDGGLFSRDKANVTEFLRPFARRVG